MRDVVGTRFVRGSFDELMYDLIREFDYPDFICNPRGREVKELLVKRLVLTNPRNRLITNDKRKANYGFTIGEFLWYMRGSESLSELYYYNKRTPSFSDDGITVNSAYGKRIFKDEVEYGQDQWQLCKKTLEQDKDSRRALLLINKPEDQFKAVVNGSKDVPCTLSLQFFIREDELYLHVNMRSNDVVWGLTSDLFSFTMLQECMLLELKQTYPDLELGRYFHTAGSIHVYERHYDMIDNMADYYDRNPSQYIRSMEPLDNLDDIKKLQELESSLRIDGKELLLNSSNETVQWMANQLVQHRRKRDEE